MGSNPIPSARRSRTVRNRPGSSLLAGGFVRPGLAPTPFVRGRCCQRRCQTWWVIRTLRFRYGTQRPAVALCADSGISDGHRGADLALSPWRDQRRSGASGVAARRDVADHRERPGPALLPRRTSGLDRALWDTFPVSVAPSAVDMGVASRRLSSLPVSRTSLRVALLGRSPCRSGARRSRAKPGLPQLAPVCRDAGPARRVRDWKTAGRYEGEARCGGRPAGGVACAG
jgi:hypothetical protein